MNGAHRDVPPAPKWLEPALQEYILLAPEEEEAEPCKFALGFI
jgi:hypothetical protein